MLLTPSDSLDGDVADLLCASDISRLFVYGGTAAVAEDVLSAAEGLVVGDGCAA